MQNFTFYVLPNGNDSNSGLSWQDPLATLQAAIALSKAAGGGQIKLGPGVWAMPTFTGHSTGRLFINASNTLIEGIPGKTIFRAMAEADGGFFVGDDHSFTGETVYRNIHLFGITIDMTAVPKTQTNKENTNSIVFRQTADCSMKECTVLGGIYMCTIGGIVNPATRILIEGNRFKAANGVTSVVFAPVNSLDCRIVRNYAAGPGGFAMDMETNAATDYNPVWMRAGRVRRRARFRRSYPNMRVVLREFDVNHVGVPRAEAAEFLANGTGIVSVIQSYLALTISGPPPIPAGIPAGGPSIGSGSKCDAVRYYALPLFPPATKLPTLAHPKSSASDPIRPN